MSTKTLETRDIGPDILKEGDFQYIFHVGIAERNILNETRKCQDFNSQFDAHAWGSPGVLRLPVSCYIDNLA